MYSFVPAIVSMMIFCVLSPKSASFMRGSGLPGTYLVLSNIFSGFKSRWVMRWLCNSCTPLLICSMHSKLSFSLSLLSLHRFSASLLHLKPYHSEPPEQYSVMYHTVSGCSMISNILRMFSFYTFLNSSLICFSLAMSSISAMLFFTLRMAMESFRSLSKTRKTWVRVKYLCEGALADQFCLLQVVLFFEI